MSDAQATGRWSLGVVLAYLTLCLVWGSTYLAIKVALEGVPPFLMAGSRFLIAGVLFLPVVFRRDARLPRGLREWTAVIVSGALMLLGANGLVTYSEVFLDSGLTALTVATNPAWAALIGGWLFASREERFSYAAIGGLALAMTGVAILHHDRWSFSSAEWPGVIAACVAPVLWATGSLVAKHFVRRADAMTTTALQMLSAALLILPLSRALGESWQPTLTPRVVWAMLFLILIGSAIVYAAYVWLLRRMPASRVLTYTYINPLVALGLGYLVLSEEIHPEVLPATALILGGLVVVYAAGKRRGRRAAEG